MAEKFSLDGQCLVTGPVLFGVPDHPSLPVPPATVTATPVDSSTVSLVFTESRSNWFDPITEYRIVSNPGGLIWTAAVGSGGTTVSGLSPGTSYRFSVSAKNSLGYGTARVSNYAVTTPGLGQQVFGGYYGGSISLTQNGVATHYLIVAPKSTGECVSVISTYSLATSRIDGPNNTAVLPNTLYSAKEFLTYSVNASGGIGGYTDWYIPAQDELTILYWWLKPGSNNFNYGYGQNGRTTYAVYPQPFDTAFEDYGAPYQTYANDFISGGSQAFGLGHPNADVYLTSTSSTYYGEVYTVWFLTGYTGTFYAPTVSFPNQFRFRAIRRQPVTY